LLGKARVQNAGLAVLMGLVYRLYERLLGYAWRGLQAVHHVFGRKKVGNIVAAVLRAARLRDHPFMQAHLRIRQLLREGRAEAASAMEVELGRLIDAQQAPERAD